MQSQIFPNPTTPSATYPPPNAPRHIPVAAHSPRADSRPHTESCTPQSPNWHHSRYSNLSKILQAFPLDCLPARWRSRIRGSARRTSVSHSNPQTTYAGSHFLPTRKSSTSAALDQRNAPASYADAPCLPTGKNSALLDRADTGRPAPDSSLATSAEPQASDNSCADLLSRLASYRQRFAC